MTTRTIDQAQLEHYRTRRGAVLDIHGPLPYLDTLTVELASSWSYAIHNEREPFYTALFMAYLSGHE